VAKKSAGQVGVTELDSTSVMLVLRN